MKKIAFLSLIVFCLVCLVSSESRAYINVSFLTDVTDGSGDALFKNGGVTPIPAGSLFLVYVSGDNSTSGFNSADPLTPTGDTLIGTFSTDPLLAGAFNGEIFGHENDSWGVGQALYGGQYLYIAVFDMAYTEGSGQPTIPVGTRYGLGNTMLLLERYNYAGQPPGPDDYGAVLEANPVTTSSTTVPEPSSMALLGIGLGLVALRRFRKK